MEVLKNKITILLLLISSLIFVGCSNNSEQFEDEVLQNADLFSKDIEEDLLVRDSTLIDNLGYKTLKVSYTSKKENTDKNSMYYIFDKNRVPFNSYFNIFNKLDYIVFDIYDKEDKHLYILNFERSGDAFTLSDIEEK